MIAIPAIDLMGGKCVQLVEGKPWSAQIEIDDPLGVAARWESLGAKRLHLIDLDAALGTGENEAIIRSLLKKIKIPVQVGGGIRDDDKAVRLLNSGASQIIVGTRAVTDVNWLENISMQFPDRIIVAIDARGSEITIKGWTDGSGVKLMKYVESIESLPLFGLLYTNVAREGRLKGIDIEPIKKLTSASKKRLFVAGGITSMQDLLDIDKAGAFGAILGMSIYKGTINLKDALERIG
ncbi:MAG: 1-(5-phosphoribosyl)-5-[(5-phosphoribosylamino)methylideneamino]imidazole-4-carboxamide isomerase [Thermoplasmata archaeon]|nr:1-(5-phosphoribosyl)-5-[(5-phosphoribosylamino)methylideneamino]imidazole-4-carboxamide isomerase [Thermoplasmata archaeon]